LESGSSERATSRIADIAFASSADAGDDIPSRSRNAQRARITSRK
jgi:hypothetical protein